MLKKVTASILAAVMLCCGFVFVGLAEESYADQIAEYFSDDPMVIRSKYSDTAVGENVSMVECGNKVYCFGWNSTQIYDTAANTWTSAPVMLSLRSEYSAVENGGKIYLVGGIIGNEVTDKVDIFDTETGTWSVGQEIPFGFVDGEAVSIGDNIYCFGGYDDVNHSVKSRDTYIYDTVNQTWSYDGYLPNGGVYTGVAVGSKIYCTAKYSGDGNYTYVYDTSNNVWSERQIRPSYSYGSVSNQEGKLMKLGEFLIFINYGSDSGSKVRYAYMPDKDIWVVLPDTLPEMDLPARRTTIIGDRIYTIKDSMHDGVMQGRLEITYIYSNQKIYTNRNNVAVGQRHILVYKDGVLMSKGNNDYGQLGNGSTAESDDFVAVNTPWTEKGEAVMSLTASGNMSYVITDKYNLYGWGQNANSQLGNGSMENVLTPELLAENVVDVDAGEAHTIILKRDATVWVSGNNTYGQLGNNSTSTKRRFAKVYEGALAIAAGDYQSYIIDSERKLYSCGKNTSGQLGINSTESMKKIYTYVMDGVTKVTAGANHAVAVKENGTVYSWGSNSYGQLGLELTVENAIAPVQSNNLVGTESIKAGGNLTSFLNGGYLYQCGYMGWSKNYLPKKVMSVTGVKEFDADELCIGMDSDNNLWQWGISTYDQKYMETNTALEPVRIGGLKNIEKVDANQDQVLAVNSDRNLFVWGRGWFGTGKSGEEVYGYPKKSDKYSSADEIARGKNHNVIISAEVVEGWGSNSNNQLGKFLPKNVIENSRVIELSGYTEEGDNYNASDYLENEPLKIAAGNDFTLVVRRHCIGFEGYNAIFEKQLVGIGRNYLGQLGTGESSISESEPVVILQKDIETVSAGDSFAVATTEDGEYERDTYVWGANEYGQLGLGHTDTVYTPTRLENPQDEEDWGVFKQVSAGPDFCVGVTEAGNVYTWGRNSAGQLGLGHKQNMLKPTRIRGLTNVREVVAGYNHALAIKKDGTLWTWGYQNDGQLGRALGNNRVPGQVLGIPAIKKAAAGRGYTVAVDVDGNVYTFGTNERSSLGLYRNVPENIYGGIGEEPKIKPLMTAKSVENTEEGENK